MLPEQEKNNTEASGATVTPAVEEPSDVQEATASPQLEEGTESLEQLIDQYVPAPGPLTEGAEHPAPSESEALRGRVVEVTPLGVVVDFGAKSEGLIPAQELMELDSLQASFEPGQIVEVQPLDQEKDGYLLLSYLRPRRRRVWQEIENSYRHHVPLRGRILDRVKGGLVVDIGVRAFLPASQLDVRPVRDLEAWKNQEISCRVLKMNRKRGNVVVSRRVVLEEELRTRREALLQSLVEGAVVSGKVKNITDYGVFVDLGGVDGLLHITDLSWGRVTHPSQVVSVGQEIQVKVLKIDRGKNRISLSHKQVLPDPFATVPERYPPGTRVEGKVVGITDYGAFVELEPGVEGLVHVSEMTWSKRIKHPSKIVSVGERVEVVVLDIKPEQHRISLGLRQTKPDPWQSLAEKYPVGSIVTGRVRNLTEFGAFVEIEEGIDGLIHVSDISWTERIEHPREFFKKGETVQAKVLKIDAENRRLSLGLKQMNDIWAQWFAQHKENQIVRGRVSKTTSFGVFVELAQGIEGLCHMSEIEARRGRKERDKEGPRESQRATLEVGKEYDFKIIRLDLERRKIGLSYRAALRQGEQEDLSEYRSSKSSPTATIGDAILSKRELL